MVFHGNQFSRSGITSCSVGSFRHRLERKYARTNYLKVYSSVCVCGAILVDLITSVYHILSETKLQLLTQGTHSNNLPGDSLGAESKYI